MIYNLVKYLLEGALISALFYLLSSEKLSLEKAIIMALITSCIFALLDYLSYRPSKVSKPSASSTEGFEDATATDDETETFDYPVQPQTPPPVQPQTPPPVHPAQPCSKSTVCSIVGNTCTYSPNATDTQKSRYLCSMNESGECDKVVPCKQSGTTCQLSDTSKTLPDLNGRTCVSEQIPVHSVCKLAQATPANNVEGFIGFSKKF